MNQPEVQHPKPAEDLREDGEPPAQGGVHGQKTSPEKFKKKKIKKKKISKKKIKKKIFSLSRTAPHVVAAPLSMQGISPWICQCLRSRREKFCLRKLGLWKLSLSMGGGWNQVLFKLLFHPNHSMIPRFSRSLTDWSVPCCVC